MVDENNFQCTIVKHIPLDFSRLEFICGPTLPEHSHVLVTFLGKWDEHWSEYHGYNLPSSTTPLQLAAILNLHDFLAWTMFINGRVIEPDDSLHLLAGDTLAIELEESSDASATSDDNSLMQSAPRPLPSSSPTLRSVRLIGLHRMSAIIDIDSTENVFEQLERRWPFRYRTEADLVTLYPVVSPPTFQTAPTEHLYLMLFRDDHFEQVNTDDVLILVSSLVESPSALIFQ